MRPVSWMLALAMIPSLTACDHRSGQGGRDLGAAPELGMPPGGADMAADAGGSKEPPPACLTRLVAASVTAKATFPQAVSSKSRVFVSSAAARRASPT